MGCKRRRIRMDALIERDGLTCCWCFRDLVRAPIEPNIDCSAHATLEHLVPVSLGGTHDIENLRLACFQCNNARGASADPYVPPR